MTNIYYTDGSCKGNPGPGGWGVYVNHSNEEFYGYDGDTTNNRMELTGAIKAVSLMQKGEVATIFCDSNYVIEGITKWIHGWKKNGWKTAKSTVKNQDLWQMLDKLVVDKKITWKWVKGHEDDAGNIKADALANLGASGKTKDIPIPISLPQPVIATKEEKVLSLIEVAKGDVLLNATTNKYYYVVKNDLTYISDSNNNESGEKVCQLLEITLKDKKKLNDEGLIEHISPLSYVQKNYQKATLTDELRKILISLLTHYNENHESLEVHLTNTCRHRIEFEETEDDDGSYGAHCVICDEYFGHYCPGSPDHTCHYQTHDNKITLITGEEIEAPEDHDSRYESWDMCIYCGGPEERK
jgi:ribonuclease HI